MSVYRNFVNSALRTCRGQPPRRSFVTQSFTGASLLRDGLLGITTNTQAAFAVGVPCGYVAAATAILNAGDDVLTGNVLSGKVSMFAAAKQVKTRAALVSAFRNATRADRIALGDVIGIDAIFDQVVAPAIVDPVTVAVEATAAKRNGKASNGNGHLHARQAAPVIVPISTH